MSHYADKVRSIMAKRGMGKGKFGNVVSGKPQASGQDNKSVPMGSKEYVLPQAFVDKVGPDNIDKMVQQTLSSVTPPDGSPKKGYRGGGRGEGYYGAGMEPGNINDTFELPTGGGNGFPQRNDIFGQGSPGRNHFTNNWGGHEPRAFDDSKFDNVDPRIANFLNVSNSNPWASNVWSNGPGTQTPPPGLPGSGQGQTTYPTYFDPWGYPFAAPATADTGSAGPHPMTPPKHDS
jgi:hypothetical protein